MAAGLLLLVGTATTASAATGTAPKTAAILAHTLTLSKAEQHQLLDIYAAQEHIPTRDIYKIRSGSTHVARASNGTLWAIEGFTPKGSDPLKVQVGFQDGGSTGIFTRAPGKKWTMRSLARPDLGCDTAIPASVLRSWRDSCGVNGAPLATKAGAKAAPASPATSALGSEIATTANNELDIRDNPSETQINSYTPDCNPFTYFENSANASDSGCGIDPSFNVQDYSEFWCSDFAKWVWSNANVTGPLSDLTPAAGSFYTYGEAEGETMPVDPPVSDAAVGDAIVLYNPSEETVPGPTADHVGIITAVDQSDGDLDITNGDGMWGSVNTVGVVAADDVTPSYFATNFEGSSSEEWIFVSPAGAVTPTLPTTYLAEMQDNDHALYGYNYGTNEPTTLGMDPGTAPATIGLSDDSTYETAFQDNGNALYLHSSGGTNINTGLGMEAGTSPAIAALSSSDKWEAAFQDNGNVLYLRSSSGTNDNTGLGMDAGTSPAIAGSGSGWIAAFQDNDNDLYITTSAGLKQATTLGMKPGTNPAITALANGGFVVAFQSNSDDLYIFSVSGTSSTDITDGTKIPTPYGMEAGTSPSIASFTDSSWRAAFQTNDQDLYTYSSAGSDDTSTMQMDAHSSPAITCLPDGTYEVAFEANNDGLDVFHTGSTNDATGLGMQSGTSPTISSPYNP
jgi:hypothetical protein